jgi:hypothetical protein
VVASGGRDGFLRVWRIPEAADIDSPSYPAGGLPLARVGEDGGKHPNVVTCIAMDPADPRAVWTTCLDGFLRRWVIEEEEEEEKGEGGGGGEAGAGDGADDGAAAAAAAGRISALPIQPPPEFSDPRISALLGYPGRREHLRLAGEWATGQPALCVSLCDEYRVVYVGTADGTAFAFDAGEPGDDGEGGPSGELCRWLAHDGGATRSIAASPGGCVTGSSTGPIMAGLHKFANSVDP